MKSLFRILELSKNEQRVVLIIMLILITIAFIGYERRVDHPPAQPALSIHPKPSSTGVETVRDQ